MLSTILTTYPINFETLLRDIYVVVFIIIFAHSIFIAEISLQFSFKAIACSAVSETQTL